MKSKAGDQLVTHAKLKSVWLRRFNPFNGEQEPPLFVAKTDVDSWQKPFFLGTSQYYGQWTHQFGTSSIQPCGGFHKWRYSKMDCL